MLGAIGFMSPWLLVALGALPLLYWLLRTVPPRPQTIAFPPTRMLKDLENKQHTPARTPWWLMLIRMLAAALVILALADPVLNPKRAGTVRSDGPVVIAIDNTWAAADKWSLRKEMIAALIAEADASGQGVIVAPTATPNQAAGVKLESPSAARQTAAAIVPEPYPPNHAQALRHIEQALAGKQAGRVVWLSDSLDHGAAAAFANGAHKIAAGGLTAYLGAPGEEPLGLASDVGQGGTLTAYVKRADGEPRAGLIQAWSARGQRLGEAPFQLGAGETGKSVVLTMPLELRNQIARLDISGVKSAGAVALLDSRSRWQRVGLIASTSREQAQPLLAPLYYLNKALAPFTEIVAPKDADLPTALSTVLGQNASVILLADVGKLVGQSHDNLDEWIKKGGVLVRFAGPRLEQAVDDLLPVPLRSGGRSLGGALSWSTPQPLSDFERDSLFAGIQRSPEVVVNRQVLADPGRIGSDVTVLARLADGTPLVTSARRGDGWIVLFHVTANTDWSNLPLSGMFVEMLRRIVGLSSVAGAPAQKKGEGTETQGAGQTGNTEVLAPIETLDGFGVLRSPPVTAQAISASAFEKAKPSAQHPPGIYGPPSAARALNLIEPETTMKPLPSLPSGAVRAAYQAEKARPLKPELLSMALGLLFIDVVAIMLLQMGGLGRRRTPAVAAAALIAAGAGFLLAVDGAGTPARAQSAAPVTQEQALGLKATLKTRLAYVITGDPATDRTSAEGLNGLTQMLTRRTAIEPAEPVGIDVTRDELAFFPIIYWPLLPSNTRLPDAVLAKVDTYMKQGGLIVFDTRDAIQDLPGSSGPQGPGAQALQRLLGNLDIPRLEAVPEGHVLTKSFYLLRTFPGRWDGGKMWVEATVNDREGGRKAQRSDGVSSIIITANDLAGAWAVDGNGRGLLPVVPGGELQREMAYRTGVNIVMYALTGNYKADQVHVPALLERLGQ